MAGAKMCERTVHTLRKRVEAERERPREQPKRG